MCGGGEGAAVSRCGSAAVVQGTDIFAPEVVVWAYQGPPQQALRALLDLAHATHPAPPPPSTRHPEPARSPRAATSDDDPIPVTRPGRRESRPARHRNDGPSGILSR
jgi:hypothetical protein